MRRNIVCPKRVFYPILFLGIFISWLLVSIAASQKVKTKDFLVQKNGGRLMFYVLRSSLDHNVDLYHPITKKDP